jgi:hypothetical protein
MGIRLSKTPFFEPEDGSAKRRVAARKEVKKGLEMTSSGWYDGGAFQREQHHFSTIVDISVEK